MIWLPLFYYYLGPVSFISYLYCLYGLRSKFSVKLIVCLAFVFMCLCTLVFNNNNIGDAFLVFRFFWGWVFFYLFFTSFKQVNPSNILKLLSILVILEVVLINFFVEPSSLPNYLNRELAPTHFAALDSYQRPNSFGGSPSVTSVLLVALLCVSQFNLRNMILPLVAIICCMSGTGFAALAMFFVYFLRLKQLVIMFGFLLGLVFFGAITLPYKISPEYLHFIFELKTQQFFEAFNVSMPAILFGASLVDVGGMGGDFQLLSFAKLNGLFGVFVLLFFVLVCLNKENRFPVIMLIVLSSHYGSMFYFSGQFLFAYFLSFGNRQALVKPTFK